MELAAVKELGTAFTNGEAAGVDITHEEEFEQLKLETDKDQGIDVAPVEWDKVAVLSSKVLAEKSKDLRVANFLCLALFHEQGFAGLAAGFALLEAMVKAEYWDTIYPQRRKRANKGRGATFEWTIKRLEKPFSELELKADQWDSAIAAGKAFSSLDAALSERLEDDAPSTYEFRSVIDRYKQEAEFLKAEEEKKQKEQEQAAAAPAEQAPAVESKPAASTTANVSAPAQTAPAASIDAKPAAVASAADVEKALRSNLQTAERVAKVLREAKLSNPYPYHILRTAAWTMIEKLPESGILPPMPNEDRIAALQQMEQSKNWEVLITECEKSFAGGAIYWLGFHRLVAVALGNIGAQDAAKTVKDNVAAFVARFPEVLERSYANGDGFADEMTKAWIEAEVMVASESSSSNEGGGGAAEAWTEAAKEAKKLAVSGNFEDGLNILRDGVRSAGAERERFCWLFQQAKYCFDAGHIDVALPQLQYLHEQIEQRGMERWEPDLNLSIIRILLACHEKKQAKQKYSTEQREQVEALRTQYCLMDPLGAMSLKQT